jgi:hypothetical protein
MASDFKTRIQINVETVIRRRDIRMKRIAFLKYKDQTRLAKRSIRND